ncbi:Uncharacterised protein [Priestia megaterium]|uniref:hypothetical protein n=1 Tax=Priestia megaterium TaxID=1404 RepID=UPI000E190F74|nr:hypothetical protein [Priestia megaterium]SSY69949.1 Uncharacterised protein [Priestia megaterium]
MMDYYNLDCSSCFRGSRDKNIKQYLLKNIDRAILGSAFEVGETDYLEKCLCDRDIKEGDLYISSDDFIFVAIRLISTQLSSFIEYCNHCKGHYIDARVEEHVRYAEDPETARPLLYGDMGEIGRELKDLFPHPLGGYKIENLIIKNLTCQNCGYGSGSGMDNTFFLPEDEFYSAADLEHFEKLIDYERINRFAKHHGIMLSMDELEEFSTYLNEYPMLAYKHETGVKIYTMLSRHLDDERADLLIGSSLYRGRSCPKGSNGYPLDRMWEPPKEFASHGRYNTVGTTALYCTDRIDYIPYEIHPNSHQQICIASIKVKRTLKILNINRLFGKFQGFIGEKVSQDGLYNPNYALTNFIAECAREIGFNGLEYRGVNGDYYKNYAFLNIEKGKDLEITDIKLKEFEIKYTLT